MERASVTGTDWSILEIDGVMSVAEAAARKVSKAYSAVEFDDLLQEAYIILATKADEMRARIDARGLELLHRALCQDLIDLARVQQAKAERNVSLDALTSNANISDEGTEASVYIERDKADIDTQVAKYNSLCSPVTVRRVGE